jgi:hypothetical protein
MSFPIHHCDPDNECPVLAGAECLGRDWHKTLDRAGVLLDAYLRGASRGGLNPIPRPELENLARLALEAAREGK